MPRLNDTGTMLNLLARMGVRAERGNDGMVTLQADRVDNLEAPYELVKTMRASILVLGPLVARFGEARVSLPGGCTIGQRPVDQHIKGLAALGAEISIEHGFVVARAKRLKGASIRTDMVTVTGTENLLMAAVLADGRTILENAAREPEIIDLAELLIKMGARIQGHGTDRIVIDGVERLHGAEHRVISDRIEAGTFLCAVGAAGGDITLRDTDPGILGATLDKLVEAGLTIETGPDWIRGAMSARPKAVGFRTHEYPGFATDMQAQLMALNTVADGTSVVVETIFENRYMRAGAAPHGRRHRHRRPHRHRARRAQAVGRHRHGHRPARLGQPGHRRPGRGRRHAGGPHLPPGPGLRPHGTETARPGRRHPTRQRQGECLMSETTTPLTLALSKGRIFEETMPLLAEAGIEVPRIRKARAS